MGPTDDIDVFIGRCNTCGEEARDVDLETAQAFFADHLNCDHAPEIIRSDSPESDHFES